MDKDKTIERLLQLKKIAVVGFSNTEGKPSYSVPRYLMREGYTIFPVNPFGPEESAGLKVNRSLSEIEEDLDLLLVFRPSHEVMALVEEALKREDLKGIWMQEGIWDEKGGELAREKGILVVMDRCIYKEHKARRG